MEDTQRLLRDWFTLELGFEVSDGAMERCDRRLQTTAEIEAL